MKWQRRIETALLGVVVASIATSATGQPPSSGSAVLPSSVNLSDVQIQLTTGGGDGCVGRCTAWRIVVRGDGAVELDDLGTPPRAQAKQRQIDSEVVIELINEFLKARFFEALGYYGGIGSAVRSGDSLLLLGGVAGTGPWTELVLRLGPTTKTVRLQDNVPVELQDLRDRVWQIGGPGAWAER